MENNDTSIENAVDLWAEISKSAEFDDVDYDSALLDEIKSCLGVDKNADFEEELKNITVEELLNALFTSLEPFSDMLNDLLNVFSKAGAKYGDNNLKITVDFDKLEIDLEHFRQDVVAFSQSIQKAVKTYFINNPWDLRKLFKFDENYYNAWDYMGLDNDEIRGWVALYINKELPSYFPKQPEFNAEVDRRIGVIWNYLHKIYTLVKSVPKAESNIKEAIWESGREFRRQSEGDISADLKQALISKADVLKDETDFFTGTMMVAVAMFVEHLKTLSKDESDALIERFKADFDNLSSNFTVTHEVITEQIKQIKSFLNLPYWKRRYEIYSAWVFTLIAKAFGLSNLNYRLVNGDTLSFSFGGSHLATYNQGEPVQIWAECRSEAITQVIGKGRSNGIQPDYTIAYEEAKDPCNAIAVVECKQYKKSSSGNFSDAIIDYANNRPNAKIFLVNYGAVGNAVNQKVINAGIDKSRFATFGHVRPRNCDSFVSALRSYLFEPMKITLRWGKCPADLDLMLSITDWKDSPINYNNMGQSNEFPYAILDRDCTDGIGPEIITVFKVESGKSYGISVDKFSDEEEISSEVTLQIECNAFHKVFTKKEVFERWDVCTVKDGKIIL